MLSATVRNRGCVPVPEYVSPKKLQSLILIV